jgi:hypothetical protein
VETTVQKRGWSGPECNNEIKERGARRQLRLRKERISGTIFSKNREPEIDK